MCDLLTHHERLEHEYQVGGKVGASLESVETLKAQRLKLQHALERLIDSFTEGLIEKDQFTSRMARTKNRIAELDTKIKDDAGDVDQLEHLRLAAKRLRELAAAVGPHRARRLASPSRHDSHARPAYRDRAGSYQDRFPPDAGRTQLRAGVHCCYVIAGVKE